MKTNHEYIKNNILALAVQGALIAMFTLPMASQAEEAAVDEAAALTHPTNSVELGGTSMSRNSAKFGEYNGLDENGAYGIANIDLRGGNGYDQGDGTTRWQIKGVDLGTTSRVLGGSVSNQGQWNIGIGYDELRHNITDTYQTPQQGNLGDNNFTYPVNFGTINGGTTLIGGVVPPSARSLNATQLGAFHTEKIHTDRKNSSFEAGYTLSPNLSVQFDYNHLKQDGAKLLGVATAGGVTIPGSLGTWRAEAVNIVMNPTNYNTDTFNLAFNWTGDKGHLTTGYYASIFRDDYDSLSSQSVMTNNATGACASGGSCVYQTTVMSTAPDNSFHQFNLTGGYDFSSATKLAGGFSYGRNTQNNTYLSGLPEISSAPRTSLDGKVITTHADFKLTHQATKDLGLSAGVKYNERDNKSPSQLYQFYAINTVATGIDAAVNAPYSNRKVLAEVAADYRLTKGQNVRLSYEHEHIKRWCNDYGVAGADCLVNPGNDEDRLGINYRLKAREGLNFNTGYTYGRRTADFEGNAITPLSGLGVPAGGDDVNAQNYKGYIAYPYAKRNQHLVKGGVNWQATEKVDIGLNGRYAHDDYAAVLGVQNGHTGSVNFDATYSYNENGSISAYATWQESKRELKSGLAPTAPGLAVSHDYDLLGTVTRIWNNQLIDTSNAIGLNAKHTGLLGGKAEVLGDLSYSLDKSHYSTQVPYDPVNCALPQTLTCGSTPDIRTQVITLKLASNYQVDKHGKVGLNYVYQHLISDDYFYNAYQYQYTPNRVMPTNQQSGTYSVNVVTATYTYTF